MNNVDKENLRQLMEGLGARLLTTEVGLQAHPDRDAAHQQVPVLSYSPITATFSADALVGSKR